MSRKFFTLFALLLVLVSLAFAQRDIEGFLEATDEILTTAEVRFDAAPEEAIALYEEALASQEEAWILFDDGDESAAFMASRNARRLLSNAVRLLGGETPDRDTSRILEILNNNDALAEELATPVEDSGSDALVDMLAHAIELNTDAHAAYEAEDFTEALHMGRTAHQILNRVSHMIDSEGECEELDPDRVLTVVEEAEAYVAGVRDDLPEDAPAEVIEILDTADELIAQAYEAYEASEYPEAIRFARTARSMANRASRPTPGGGGRPDGE